MPVMLYYPQVTPPTEVIHQALLYWDGLATVVPRDPSILKKALSAELQELQGFSLYEPVHLSYPSLTLNYGVPTSKIIIKELRKIAARPVPPRIPSRPDAFIWVSKTSDWIERELRSLGLGERRREAGWSQRIVVPREVQEIIVGALAREIAYERSDLEKTYLPYTDSDNAWRNTLRKAGDAPSQFAWEIDLGRLLPTPAPGTSTRDVVAFRHRYADERLRLVRTVHRMKRDLQRDYDHPADVLAQLKVELEQAVSDYRAAARGSRMAWVERSITVAIALAAGAGGALVDPHIGWLFGTASGYALNIATREIRPLGFECWINGTLVNTDDFSYLHRVQTELS